MPVRSLKWSFCAFTVALLFITGQVSADDIYEQSMIVEAQRFLFERGWDTGWPDGVIGRKTRAAIRDYQEQNDIPVTGELSFELYARFMRVGLPDDFIWGALSASVDGAHAWMTNTRSRQSAEAHALARCREVSSKPDKCIVISIRYRDGGGWMVAKNCLRENDTTRYRHILLVGRHLLPDALDKTDEIATMEGYSSGQCSLTKYVRADGNG